MQAYQEILRLNERNELPEKLNSYFAVKQAERVVSGRIGARASIVISVFMALMILFLPGFPKGRAGAASLLAIGLVLTIGFVVISPTFSKAKRDCQDWLTDYETLLKTLGLRPDVFANMNWAEQRDMAKAKVHQYGLELVAMEEQHRPNSLAEEVVTYRRRFESQYALCLRFNLIDNTGYRNYLMKGGS